MSKSEKTSYFRKRFSYKNHVTVRHAENGKCILNNHQEELIATLDIASNPQLRTSTSVLLPGRTLAVIQVNSNLEPEQSGQIYEVKTNIVLSEKYPNVYIVPMIHNVDTYITDSVPMVLIIFWLMTYHFQREKLWVSYKINH